MAASDNFSKIISGQKIPLLQRFFVIAKYHFLKGAENPAGFLNPRQNFDLRPDKLFSNQGDKFDASHLATPQSQI